jgi:hypothetical protein
VAILIIIWFRHQEVYLNEEFSVFFGGRPMLKHLHLLSEQWLLNPCWLKISSGIILPNLWGIIDDYRGLYDPIYDNIWIYIYISISIWIYMGHYNNPIGKPYEPTRISWNAQQMLGISTAIDSSAARWISATWESASELSCPAEAVWDLLLEVTINQMEMLMETQKDKRKLPLYYVYIMVII